MFNPIPPQEPELEGRERDTAFPVVSLLASPSHRILAFALKRGVALAAILGGPLGFFLGMAAIARSTVFVEDALSSALATVFFWTCATIAAFLPFLILVCGIAMSAQVIAAAAADSSRRTARIVKKCLVRRFDSPP